MKLLQLSCNSICLLTFSTSIAVSRNWSSDHREKLCTPVTNAHQESNFDTWLKNVRLRSQQEVSYDKTRSFHHLNHGENHRKWIIFIDDTFNAQVCLFMQYVQGVKKKL